MTCVRAKGLQRSNEQTLKTLVEAVQPSVAEHTCRIAFGGERSQSSRTAIIDGHGVTVAAVRGDRQTADEINCRNRGLVSHLDAQAVGVTLFVEPHTDHKTMIFF